MTVFGSRHQKEAQRSKTENTGGAALRQITLVYGRTANIQERRLVGRAERMQFTSARGNMTCSHPGNRRVAWA